MTIIQYKKLIDMKRLENSENKPMSILKEKNKNKLKKVLFIVCKKT